MWISGIRLNNIRGFVDSGNINFSRNINILIGPNNSGKSTILRAINQLQAGELETFDITKGKQTGTVEVDFEDPQQFMSNNYSVKFGLEGTHKQTIQTIVSQRENIIKQILSNDGNKQNNTFFSSFASRQPNNLIFPHLSKRKVIRYNETINYESTNSVIDNYGQLYPKIDRLLTSQLESRNEFITACQDILGIPISTTTTANGKIASYEISNSSRIPITLMGEGIVSLLGLIVDLCVAENQIFIIEEPENDIHPKALKALLRMIELKSETNQFFISTHSNIVLRYLGGDERSKTFNVSMLLKDKIPNSSIKELSTSDETRKALEDLGYEPFDFNLWSAWLFLEEASAESVVNEILIPFFAKNLQNKLRTFSARTVSEVASKVDSFNRLFVFLHLEPMYKNKVWVVVDNGREEEEIMDNLRKYYVQKHNWNKENFQQFKEHDFEQYYPIEFKEKVVEVLSIKDKRRRQEEKNKLVKEVMKWAKENPEKAKKEFAESAKEVIELLRQIEAEIE